MEKKNKSILIIGGEDIAGVYSKIASHLVDHNVIVMSDTEEGETIDRIKKELQSVKEHAEEKRKNIMDPELPESFMKIVDEVSAKGAKYLSKYPIEKETPNPATRSKSRYKK